MDLLFPCSNMPVCLLRLSLFLPLWMIARQFGFIAELQQNLTFALLIDSTPN
jgi:hypothetical protein